MNKIITNNLKEFRTEVGLRQLDVACRLGFISTERISKWEKGLAFPSMFNLFKLAVIYNKLPHELYPEYFKNLILNNNIYCSENS